MAKHDQKPSKRLMVCIPCKQNNCLGCVDIIRLPYSNKPICECTRKNHSGEAIDNQILDPETPTVYMPGGEVDIDGNVTFYGKTRHTK